MEAPLTTKIVDLLASGGDERIALSEVGLNKYGCSPQPRLNVTGLGSCTSSSSSPHGFAAATHAFARLNARQCDVATLFDETRAEIRSLMRLPETVEVSLAPSATDVEMLATAIAAGDRSRPLLNILVGPSEVGSGTQNAAECRYHNPLTPDGGTVDPGEPINAELAECVSMKCVEIRDSQGRIRPAIDLEAEVTEIVVGALDDGLRVLLHVVAHSKTGITAPRLSFAERLKRDLGSDITIVVDAAQGRLGQRRINELLLAGCQVIWTGSKFVGGPPFSGALFAPRGTADSDFRIPQEFNRFFSLDELPQRWRSKCEMFTERQNPGAALRWVAATEELKRFYNISHDDRVAVMSRFEKTVARVLSETDGVRLQACDRDEGDCTLLPESVDLEIERFRTVFSFCIENEKRELLSREELVSLHRNLNANGFHLGQPVKLCKHKWALRVALSMPMVVELATAPALGTTIDARFSWLETRLRKLCSNISTCSYARS